MVSHCLRVEVGCNLLAWNTLVHKTPVLSALCLQRVFCVGVKARWYQGCLPHDKDCFTRGYSTLAAQRYGLEVHRDIGAARAAWAVRGGGARVRTTWPNYALFRQMDVFFIDIILLRRRSSWVCIPQSALVRAMTKACRRYMGGHISRRLALCYLQNLRGSRLVSAHHAGRVWWSVHVEGLVCKLRPYTGARLLSAPGRIN